MNDFATLAGQPRRLVVGDETFLVHPVSMLTLARLQAWVEEQCPNPVAAVKSQLDGLPPDIQRYMIDRAIAEARKPKPRLGEPEANALAFSFAGMCELVYLVIAEGDRSFTREKGREVFRRMSPEQLAEFLRITGLAGEPGEEPGDPKANGPASMMRPVTAAASPTPGPSITP